MQSDDKGPGEEAQSQMQALSELVELVEDSIRRGLPNATLIEWVYRERPATLIDAAKDDEPDPAASMMYAADQFRRAGWIWNLEKGQFEKDGWLIWFRSQGQLAPPICQWIRI